MSGPPGTLAAMSSPTLPAMPPSGWPPQGPGTGAPQGPPPGPPGAPGASGPDDWIAPPREALDFPVFFDPGPAVARWRAYRGAIVSRVIGLVVSALIWGVLWWISRDNLWEGFWWVLGISMGLSVVLLVWSIVRSVLAKREIHELHEGLAIGIGRGGIFLDGYLPWTHATSFVTRRPGLRGSHRLVVTAANGVRRELPLEWLSSSPASVHGAVWALSDRRFAVDLSVFDR